MSFASLQAHWLGSLNYPEALVQQEQKVLEVQQNPKNYVLGLEHPKVITLGVRGNPDEDLLMSKKSLQQQGFSIETVDRGGQATLHSPGQLVIYPIIDLAQHQLGVQEFCHKLLTCTQQLLLSYGVETSYDESQVGLFTSVGKIMFLGVRVRKNVSFHGLSLNVHNDLDLFQHIRSCGQEKASLDRLEAYSNTFTSNPIPSCEKLFSQWFKLFKQSLTETSLDE